MIQINEFALAVGLFVLSTVAFAIQIFTADLFPYLFSVPSDRTLVVEGSRGGAAAAAARAGSAAGRFAAR